ncbi:hypothetical protein, partial [Rubripirellula obstinata]
VDEVRADGPHRNGALRITIACTGVAAAHFSLCLHVKSRHLGDAYRYPTEIAMKPIRVLAILAFAAVGCSFPLLNPNREGFAPWEKLPDGNGITWVNKYVHDPGIDPLYLASFRFDDETALQLVVKTFGLSPLPADTDVATFTETMPDSIDWFPLPNVSSTYVFADSNSYRGGNREYASNLWVDSTQNLAIIERTWW